MTRASLTLRLLLVVAAAELLLAAGLGWAGIGFTQRQLRAAFDTELRGRLLSVAALVRYPETGRTLLFDATLLPPSRDRRHPAFYRVLTSEGGLIASSFPADVALPPPASGPEGVYPGLERGRFARRVFWHFERDGLDYRGLVLTRVPVLDTEENLQGPPETLTVYYAAPMLDFDGEAAAAGLAIGGTSLVLLALTLWMAWWAIRRELHPLHELAQQAAAISPHNWEFRPGPRTAATAELEPLIQALELMLGRLHASYQQQREFMADAAHHLKTPVAILKSTLQALLRRPREAGEYEAAAQASLQDVERLEQLLQRMLRLARLEQQADDDRVRPLALVELGASCRAALERVQPLARDRGVALRGGGLDHGSRVRADPDDLELVWVNLLENAIQHSPAGATVEIVGEHRAGSVAVWVRDQGTGIPVEDVPSIFERFRRGNASRPGGFGLGLAIARTIVLAYGGTIAVEPHPGPGATLCVTLPAGA